LICAALEQDTLTQFFNTRLVRAAARQGVSIKFIEPKLSWSGFRASRLSFFVPQAVLGADFSEIRILPEFSFPPSGNLYAKLYDGLLSVEGISAEGLVWGSVIGLQVHSAALKSVQLQLHPQLLGMGIASGQLDAALSGLKVIGDGRPIAGKFELAVKGLTIKQSPLAAGPFLFPVLENAALHINGEFSEKQLSLPVGTLDSSLGALSSEATITDPWQPELAMLSFNATISLSDKGLSSLGNWLPVLSGGRLGPETKIITVNLAGPLRRPRLSLNGQLIRLPY